jgi:HAD superfamily hydrolase (TIGR01509 family)
VNPGPGSSTPVRYPYLVLDWSGTVADDLPAVFEGANAVLEAAGRRPLDLASFRREFELPFMRFYERYAPDMPREEVDRHYFQRLREVEDRVTLLPHAEDFLAFCHASGRRAAVLTSVDVHTFNKQLDQFGLRDSFEAIECGVEDKREGIHHLLERLGWDPSLCLMVGDMPHDIDAGHAAGMAACGLRSGYATENALRNAGPELLLDHLCELRAYLAGCDAVAQVPWLTVGALVRGPDERLLFVRTNKWSGLWGIPGGKVRWGEAMMDALHREIREETGLEIQEPRLVLVQEAVRHPEFHRPVHMLLVNYVARTSSLDVQLNDEAQEYRWVAPDRATELPLNEPTRRLIREIDHGA